MTTTIIEKDEVQRDMVVIEVCVDVMIKERNSHNIFFLFLTWSQFLLYSYLEYFVFIGKCTQEPRLAFK